MDVSSALLNAAIDELDEAVQIYDGSSKLVFSNKLASNEVSPTFKHTQVREIAGHHVEISSLNLKQTAETLNTALKKSEARFRTIFEQSPFSIQIFNRDGKTLAVNQAWKELLGLTQEFIDQYIMTEYNILKDPLLEANGHIEFIKRGFAGEETDIPVIYYDPSTLDLPGRASWIASNIYPLRDSQGEISEVVIVHQDVTEQYNSRIEREQLINRLAIERNQLSAIISQMPVGLMLMDAKNGSILLKNQKHNEMYPETVQLETVYKGDFKAFYATGEPCPLSEWPVIKSMSTGETVEDFDMMLMFGTTKQIYITCSSAPIFDEQGNIETVVLITRDITHQVKKEKNLALVNKMKSALLSTLEYEAVLTQVTTLCLPYFCDGAIIDLMEGSEIHRLVTKHVDPEAQKFMMLIQQKYPPTLTSPAPTPQVIKSGNVELLEVVDNKVIEEHTVNGEHADIIRSIGMRSHIAVPLKIRGTIIGAMNFLITTDRKYFDKDDIPMAVEIATHAAFAIENSRLYQNAKKALQLRDDFISIASHELKTPITSLNLQVEVLSKMMKKVQTAENEFTKKTIANTHRIINRLNRLIDEMLDISRIASGRLKLNLKRVDLVKLIRMITERNLIQYSEMQVRINLDVPEECLVTCDASRMDHVLNNLIVNGIRYGERKPLHISLKKEGDRHIIQVVDEGRGIPKEDQERIFERYERAVAQKDIIGFGLGLYVSRQIMNEHGGSIRVESNSTGGSTFIVELPDVG